MVIVNSAYTSKQLLAMIRTAAGVGKVIYTQHATERMLEREISRIMVVRCLQSGYIQASRPVVHNIEYGTYECRLSHYYAGVQYDVVTAVDPNNPAVIIVTVIDTEE